MMRFARRWLADQGFSGPDLLSRLRASRARILRYPPLMRPVMRFAPEFIEWLAPLLVLARWRPASELRGARFEEYLERLETHPSPLLRGLALLARYPLLEQAARDVPTPPATRHPLAGRLRTKPSRTRVFDVAVIGSGAGGAPVAWSLARRGLDVAVLEAGGLVAPASVATALERYYLHQASTVATGTPYIPVLAGRTVGGSTSINSGTCLRPRPEALKAWDQRLGSRFAQGELDPWLDQVERVLGVGIPPRQLLGRSAELFERGLAAMGRTGAFVLPRNAPSCRGDGRCCFVCPSGAKRSTDRAFLPEAVEAGGEILSPALVVRIREGAETVRVDAVGPEGRWSLEARRLVVAAGALLSPGLVRANRLGTRWREAGLCLKVHPASKVLAHFPELVDGEKGIPQSLGYRAPEFPRLAFEGIFTPAAALAPIVPLVGRRLQWWFDRYDHVATFGVMTLDRGTGSVRSVGDYPVIRYSMDPADARELAAGVIHIGEVFFAAGADRVLLPFAGANNEFTSIEDLRRIEPEDIAGPRLHACGFHPQGTCGMGRVVDLDLRLHGSRRIQVCDASVFPDTPAANPQLTIMALSLRLAERLAAELTA